MLKEGQRRKNIGQCQDILWRTVPRSHIVFGLHARKAIQIRPRQQRKRRNRQYRKRRKRRDYDFSMMQHQHQDQLDQMIESKKQALEMAQHSITQMAEKMTVMYNNLQAEEKDNDDPNKDSGQRHQRKKSSAPKRATKANASKGKIMNTLKAGGTSFRKILF